jgi:Ran GTPase-activating protein (RanGAP) involved in mRNA processing and transport
VVTVVDVSGNYFGNEGVAALLEVLAIKPNLTFVALPGATDAALRRGGQGTSSAYWKMAASSVSADDATSAGANPTPGAAMAAMLNISNEHATMLYTIVQSVKFGKLGSTYIAFAPDADEDDVPAGCKAMHLNTLSEVELGKRLAKRPALRARIECEWRGDTRYCCSEHGVFQLQAPIDAGLNRRSRELEQAVLDTNWQQQHNVIFTGLALNKPEVTRIEWGNVGLGDVTAVRLIKNIHMNIYVEEVNLSGNNFSTVVVRELLASMKTLKTLTSLKLMPCPLVDDTALIADAEAFQQTVRDSAWIDTNRRLLSDIADNVPRVTELNASNQGLGDDAAIELATALHPNNTLTALNLSGNKFGTKGATALAGVLRSKTSFVELTLLPQPVLKDTELVQELSGLERTVQQAQLLKLLVRSEDGIMALDSAHFSEGSASWLLTGPLAFNNSVVDINLEHCIRDFPQAGSRNERRLVELLSSNRTIATVHVEGLAMSKRTVDLVWSRRYNEEFGDLLRRITGGDEEMVEAEMPDGIGDLGAIAFAGALRLNSVVTSIRLGANCIGHNGSRALLGVIRASGRHIEIKHEGNPTLAREILALSDRAWCDAHSLLLARLKSDDPTLTELFWNRRNLGNGVAFKIAAAIKTNTALLKLDLSENKITEVGVQALLDAVAANTGLIEVHLEQGDGGGDGSGPSIIRNSTVVRQIREMEQFVTARYVCTQVAENSNMVTAINWAGKGFTDTLLRALASALSGNTNVERVDLRDVDEQPCNRFTDEGATALLSVLSTSTTLVELRMFPNSSIRDPNLRRELEALEQDLVDKLWLSNNASDLEAVTNDDMQAATSFDFNDDGFGDVGAFALANALLLGAHPPGTEEHSIDVALSTISTSTDAVLAYVEAGGGGADGGSGFAGYAGPGNAHLRSINVGFNQFGPAGLRALVTALELCSALTKVTILPAPKAISDPAGLKLAANLEQRVRDRAWSAKHAVIFGRLVRNDPTLTEIDWSNGGAGSNNSSSWSRGEGLGDGVALELAKSLRSNTTVRLVNLSRNRITDAGAQALQEALRTNIAAVKLCLLPNELIKTRAVQVELREMNKFFTGADWERPRKMDRNGSRTKGGSEDGNMVPWTLPNGVDPSLLRAPLHPVSNEMEFSMPVGGAWEQLPDDAIRLERLAPGQAARPYGKSMLSASTMRRRREQLAVRLSACPEGSLESFAANIEENQRGWDRLLLESPTVGNAGRAAAAAVAEARSSAAGADE